MEKRITLSKAEYDKLVQENIELHKFKLAADKVVLIQSWGMFGETVAYSNNSEMIIKLNYKVELRKVKQMTVRQFRKWRKK